MKVVFMGTPDFAALTLKRLIDEKYTVAAVFTQPDKPVGRKRIITPPPVKSTASENGIPVFQPQTLKNDEPKKILENIAPDIIVVVAYGKILPPDILSIPKYGCVNVHASLLPKYRGASPIQWSIVCGEKSTGVTTMLMDEGMDTGDILLSSTEDILPTDTAETLFDRLAVKGADLCIETLKSLENGEIVPKKQDDSAATYAPIITKEMAKLDFSITAREICCLVRGFYPWPVAYTVLPDGKKLKVYSAIEVDGSANPAGTVAVSDKRLVVACGNNTSVELCEVQLEGKSRMSAKNLLNGYCIKKGTVLNA